MKKLSSLALLAILALSLTGCGKDDAAATGSTDTGSSSTSTAETPQAMYEKAKDYYSGANNTLVDKAKAFELFSKAAEQGDSGAMFFVGVMYETGEAGEQNDQKALEWFEKSDKAGCGAAAEWITKVKKKMAKKK